MLAEAAAVLPQPVTTPMQPKQADGAAATTPKPVAALMQPGKAGTAGATKRLIIPTGRKYDGKDAKALQDYLTRQGIHANVEVGTENVITGELITDRKAIHSANALDSSDAYVLKALRIEVSDLQLCICEMDSETSTAFNKTEQNFKVTKCAIDIMAEDMKNLILYVKKLENERLAEKKEMAELIKNLSTRVMLLEENTKKDIPDAETAGPPAP